MKWTQASQLCIFHVKTHVPLQPKNMSGLGAITSYHWVPGARVREKMNDMKPVNLKVQDYKYYVHVDKGGA